MKHSEQDREQPSDTALWVLATSVGWALVPFTALDVSFRTYAEIVRQLPVHGLVGLVLGMTTGLSQAVVWNKQGRPSARWFLATALGYGIAFPTCLILFTLMTTFSWTQFGQHTPLLQWTEPGTIVFYPLLQTLALSGGIVGAAQWLALRRLLPRARRAMTLLWVFGVWLSLNLGMYLGALVRAWALGLGWHGQVPGLLGRTVAGATIGLLTSVLITILLRELQRMTFVRNHT
jgi:hypothetical protein